MPDCIFCKIVRGEIPATKVFEDETTLAFLDITPVNPGHTLVIPKKHSADIFEIEENEWNAVTKTARLIAHALEKSLSPEGVNIGMNNRHGAGQTVFHAHIHVMPRTKDDGYDFWHGKPYASGEADATADKIKKALA